MRKQTFGASAIPRKWESRSKCSKRSWMFKTQENKHLNTIYWSVLESFRTPKYQKRSPAWGNTLNWPKAIEKLSAALRSWHLSNNLSIMESPPYFSRTIVQTPRLHPPILPLSSHKLIWHTITNSSKTPRTPLLSTTNILLMNFTSPASRCQGLLRIPMFPLVFRDILIIEPCHRF